MSSDAAAAARGFRDRAAHELRTPLAIILLELGHIPDPKARDVETLIEKYDRRLRSLLGLAELEEAFARPPERFDLSAAVSDACEAIQDLAADRVVSLRRDIIPGVSIFGHRDAVFLGLIHIVENAILHGRSTTVVEVRLDQHGLVVISDDGDGLNLSPIERAFEPFVHGDSDEPGAGLGLSIAHVTASMHSGDCQIETTANGGTIVRLDFRNAIAPV